ncbi:MAG: UDP-N-acetylglucosamine--N-acetylmuramyl-(pentapeptide) pyrophosphoryl-undecaprenol N-acetylglucosamine transferase [Phycisphaerae bacterium]
MSHFYFAGGGTGGHIYPAIAVAQELSRLESSCKITFFCSERSIDVRVLKPGGYRYVPLAVRGFPKNPIGIFSFVYSQLAAKREVIRTIRSDGDAKPVLLSVGGFVSSPAILAAHKLKIPVAMLNVDATPGKANKLMGRFARDIFVQFEQSAKSFGFNRRKVITTGCPLRPAFFKANGEIAIKDLELSPKKKILLVTGASGGAANINGAVGYLLDRLNGFAADWQIVHLAGIVHFDAVRTLYRQAKINHKVLDYYDDMPNLLAAADIAIGRAGAMSIAEFAASQTPAICLPYPYHADCHQRLNAQYLVDAGCGVIVDDLCDIEKTSEILWPALEELMNSDEKRRNMRENCGKIVNPAAAEQIAIKLLSY